MKRCSIRSKHTWRKTVTSAGIYRRQHSALERHNPVAKDEIKPCNTPNMGHDLLQQINPLTVTPNGWAIACGLQYFRNQLPKITRGKLDKSSVKDFRL